MRFCNGKDLSRKTKLDISISEFATSSAKLFDDTQKLSELKYIIYDTFISNVMYDKGFRMIDTDDYIKDTKMSLQEIEAINYERLNKMLVNIFINSTDLAALFFQDVEMTKLMASCNSGKTSFEDLFNTVCMRAFEIAGNELKNVKEVGLVLKKAKKL